MHIFRLVCADAAYGLAALAVSSRSRSNIPVPFSPPACIIMSPRQVFILLLITVDKLEVIAQTCLVIQGFLAKLRLMHACFVLE